MKQLRFPTPVLFLAICTLLIASADQSANARDSSTRSGPIFATSAADGGRLFIKRLPVLGFNVAIAISIDGQLAGTLMWGHTYDRYITPGRHVLVVAPNRTASAVWQTTLDVRRGQTYSYSASYNVDKLVLTPVAGSQ